MQEPRMKKLLKLDLILSWIVLILFITFQLNFAFSVGVCCADDGQHAAIAKNLANGLGYVTTLQEGVPHFEIIKFDPRIGNGPTTILPAALLIKIFGNHYWTPGLAHVIVIALLLVSIGFLLKKFDAGFYLFFITLLFFFISYALMTYHFEQWYALLGEIPTVLLFLIGVLIFYWKDTRGSYLLSGLVFSLAANAKLVILISVGVFVISAYILDRLVWREKRFDGLQNLIRVFTPLLIGLLIPFLAYEAWKVLSLGFSGFKTHWLNYISFLDKMAVPNDVDQGLRTKLQIRTEVFHERFGIAFLTIPVVLLTSGFLIRKNKRLFRVVMVIIPVIVIYSVWWFVFSLGWPRYYIICLTMIIFLAVIPLLEVGRQKLYLLYLIPLLLWTSTAWGRVDFPLEKVRGSFFSATLHTQNLIEISERLTEHPGDILLTQWWGSSSDMEYLMKSSQNFTAYWDPGLSQMTPYWLALNKKFLYEQDKTFIDFMNSCDVILEDERYFLGECIISREE